MEEALEHSAVTNDGHGAQRRLRGFGLHLVGYFLMMGLLVTANLLTAPEIIGLSDLWFVWPGVGWGGILAVHAAYVMGLFGALSGPGKS